MKAGGRRVAGRLRLSVSRPPAGQPRDAAKRHCLGANVRNPVSSSVLDRHASVPADRPIRQGSVSEKGEQAMSRPGISILTFLAGAALAGCGQAPTATKSGRGRYRRRAVGPRRPLHRPTLGPDRQRRTAPRRWLLGDGVVRRGRIADVEAGAVRRGGLGRTSSRSSINSPSWAIAASRISSAPGAGWTFETSCKLMDTVTVQKGTIGGDFPAQLP